MSDVNINDLAKQLGDLTVMQLVDLTKKLEADWGVSATPQAGNAPVQMPGTETPSVEQTEFTVVLASFAADKKMAVVKAVRELTGLGLLESKQLVEGAPKSVKESVGKAEADELKAKLTEAGAVIEVK